MKTLNVIYLCRVGLAVLAALIATLVVDLKVGDPLINGISIGLLVYLVSYYLLKGYFVNKVDSPTKILTMGIGAYFLTFLLCWTLLTTLTLGIPTAAFTVDTQHPEIEQTITFDAHLSEDADGEIVKYVWSFGDETTDEAVEPVITHSYSSAGEFTVTLVVVDDHGLTHSNATTITVLSPS